MRRVSFADPGYAPVELPEAARLSQHLTVENSPILFGCRTGLCGTCVCTLVSGDVPPADADEQEVLDIVAEGRRSARLACQIRLVADIELQVRG